jgi:chemotaxis regulatin CheY-phosphate phosphatase CheZ
MNLSISKRQLLSDFRQIDQLMQDYRGFLATAEQGKGWEQDAIRILRHLQLQLYQANVSLSTFELVRALLKQILVSIPTEKFQFNIVSVQDGDDPEPEVPGDASLEQPEATNAPSPEQIISWIAGLVKTAPLELQEKLRKLLAGIHELFDQMQVEYAEGVDSAMTVIHQLTTNMQTRSLVREIALITREVFESLKIVSDEIPIDSLAETSGGISVAVKRLHQVVSRLDDSTLECIEILEKINETGEETKESMEAVIEILQDAQHRLMLIKMEHPELEGPLTALQNRICDEVGAQVMGLLEQTRMNQEIYIELISNQSFHELSARTLKKVIAFVESLEKQLLDMLAAFRPDVVNVSVDEQDSAAPIDVQEETETQTQADVDKLLAELGF